MKNHNFLEIVFVVKDYLFHLNFQVATKYGSLNGKWMKSRNGRNFVGFEGIPFARPPVGELRFKVLHNSTNFSSIFNCNSLCTSRLKGYKNFKGYKKSHNNIP